MGGCRSTGIGSACSAASTDAATSPGPAGAVLVAGADPAVYRVVRTFGAADWLTTARSTTAPTVTSSGP